MGTLRVLLRKNYWTSAAPLVVLLLWVGSAPVLMIHWLGHALVTDVSPADRAPGDEKGDQDVLTSLEAVVAPVAKLQLAVPVGLVPQNVVHEAVEPVYVALRFPQNNYLRILLRLITPANAP